MQGLSGCARLAAEDFEQKKLRRTGSRTGICVSSLPNTTHSVARTCNPSMGTAQFNNASRFSVVLNALASARRKTMGMGARALGLSTSEDRGDPAAGAVGARRRASQSAAAAPGEEVQRVSSARCLRRGREGTASRFVRGTS